MRSDKDQSCSVLDGLFQVGDSYDIVLELNAREVLSVFVLRVDNLSKLLALKLYDQESGQIPQTIEKPDLFLIHPNSDARIVKDVRMLFSVHTGKPSDSRTPLHLSHQPSASTFNPSTQLPPEKTHQLPEPTIATFSLPIFEVTVN